MIEGNSIGIDEPQPPYGLSDTVYNALMVSPYNLADRRTRSNASPYPLTFPAAQCHGRQQPGQHLWFSITVYNPQSGMTAPTPVGHLSLCGGLFPLVRAPIAEADRLEHQLRGVGGSPSALGEFRKSG